ncbi:TPA: M20/M25/M40 family metallo-hydrolase, partial [Staphylococcus aureus]|nr:M20/M25/M40 family metallo-hydrolase [Staphylococcus aureus]HEI7994592.1 M20/M25/M40 family metallo-hydrolase [Staphylococcus aureus]
KEQGHSCGEALQHVLTQISQIQQFHLNGLKRNIVHIGHFKAGEAINTVPSNGYLEGTIRTYDIDDLTIVKNQMQKIAESVKLLFNVDCEVKFAEGYPPTINSPKLRTQIEDALIKADLNVYDKPTPFLFGEDFSFYGQQLAPAYFVFIGTRNEDKGFVTGLHTSHLNFDEKVLINVANFYENLLNNYKEV